MHCVAGPGTVTSGRVVRDGDGDHRAVQDGSWPGCGGSGSDASSSRAAAPAAAAPGQLGRRVRHLMSGAEDLALVTRPAVVFADADERTGDLDSRTSPTLAVARPSSRKGRRPRYPWRLSGAQAPQYGHSVRRLSTARG
ncbi:hypothetical protein NGM37_58560, partial [Streptomyces sp. TRM76130]|nr:hypothetical protein [Streptomyces sp. TRM76130]